jgi:hypothetical protein
MFLEANWRPARRYGIAGNGRPHVLVRFSS